MEAGLKTKKETTVLLFDYNVISTEYPTRLIKPFDFNI